MEISRDRNILLEFQVSVVEITLFFGRGDVLKFHQSVVKLRVALRSYVSPKSCVNELDLLIDYFNMPI